MKQKRTDKRKPIDYPCWIDAGADQPPIECRIQDVSKSGIRLACDVPDLIPDEVTLHLTWDRTVSRRCRVVWRDSDALGLSYLKQSVMKTKTYVATFDVDS
jgi:hypothetical protein